ncbi:MAG: thioredoxin family protein, partial [Alphaproteobacteria bacterium]|nr:thioredoxin family protein [Alphaproteobacteria bacterium]
EGAGGLAGNFVTGAFATLLATPCSAPFLGTAIGFALARGPGEIFAIFAALGVGMAAPYLLVALFPGLATGLPRPGPWMVRLRRIMALALVATAVWLLWVLEGVAGFSVSLAVASALAALGLLFWLRHLRPGASRAAAGAMVLAVAFAFAAPSWLSSADVRGDEDMATVAWQPFDVVAIGEAVAAGKTVFVDVTADWCVTCKVNKRLVIASAEVRERLEAPDVVCLRADWTRPNADIASYLASFGRYGIPFNVVYGPASRDGLVLPELLSKGAVLEALDAAAAG